MFVMTLEQLWLSRKGWSHPVGGLSWCIFRSLPLKSMRVLQKIQGENEITKMSLGYTFHIVIKARLGMPTHHIKVFESESGLVSNASFLEMGTPGQWLKQLNS